MRAIKDRKEQASHEAGDLRGLGRDPLLTDSAPYACLTVMVPESQSGEGSFTDVCSQFGLVQELSAGAGQNVYHFSHRQRKDGHHKSQAVDLYGVALVLLNRNSETRCALHEVKQLQRRLANFTPAVEAEYGPERGVHLVQQTSPGQLTIAPPVTLYLAEAGIGQITGSATTTQTLHQMKETLKVARQQAKETKGFQLRKVG